MREKNSKTRIRLIYIPNMASFVSLILAFVLLIIAAFNFSPAFIPISVKGSAGEQLERIEVIVGNGNSLEVKGEDYTEEVNLETLLTAVRRLQNNAPPNSTAVVVSAEKSVSYERVINVLDALQRAGIPGVALSVAATK